MKIDTTDFQEKYLNKSFLIIFVIVFLFLYILVSFVKFLGQIPILLIITFVICSILRARMKSEEVKIL